MIEWRDDRSGHSLGEQQLRTRFALVVTDVVAAPEPYTRLLRNGRRRRRGRFAALGATVIAVVVAGVIGVAMPQAAEPKPAPTGARSADWIEGEPISSWTWKLLESPVRGSLSGDQGYLAELTAAAELRGFGPSELSTVQVLFAGDVGQARLASIAYRNNTHAMVVWVMNRRGTTAADLANSDQDSVELGGYRSIGRLGPMTGVEALDDRIASELVRTTIVPSGCVLATSTDPAGRAGGQRWTVSPTGDYLARSGSDARGEWLQATCEGKVTYRDFWPANEGGYHRAPVTAEEVTAALSGVRGQPDRAAAHAAMDQVRAHTAVIAGPTKVWFSGPLPSVPGRVFTLMTTPAGEGSFTVFATDIQVNQIGAGVIGYLDREPSLLAYIVNIVPIDDLKATFDILALTPPGAVRVVVRSGGRTLATGKVSAGVGAVSVASSVAAMESTATESTATESTATGFTVTAYDAAGRAVATGSTHDIRDDDRRGDSSGVVTGWD